MGQSPEKSGNFRVVVGAFSMGVRVFPFLEVHTLGAEVKAQLPLVVHLRRTVLNHRGKLGEKGIGVKGGTSWELGSAPAVESVCSTCWEYRGGLKYRIA